MSEHSSVKYAPQRYTLEQLHEKPPRMTAHAKIRTKGGKFGTSQHHLEEMKKKSTKSPYDMVPPEKATT